VKISRDGQEIAENIGYQLCRLIDSVSEHKETPVDYPIEPQISKSRKRDREVFINETNISGKEELDYLHMSYEDYLKSLERNLRRDNIQKWSEENTSNDRTYTTTDSFNYRRSFNRSLSGEHSPSYRKEGHRSVIVHTPPLYRQGSSKTTYPYYHKNQRQERTNDYMYSNNDRWD